MNRLIAAAHRQIDEEFRKIEGYIVIWQSMSTAEPCPIYLSYRGACWVGATNITESHLFDSYDAAVKRINDLWVPSRHSLPATARIARVVYTRPKILEHHSPDPLDALAEAAEAAE